MQLAVSKNQFNNPQFFVELLLILVNDINNKNKILVSKLNQ